MRKIITLSIALAVVAALVGLVTEVQAADGKTVFEAQKCGLCHSVSSAGIEGKMKTSTDLTGVGDKHDGEWIKQYVTKQVQLDGKDHKKEFKGSDEELQALVDWLLEQK